MRGLALSFAAVVLLIAPAALAESVTQVPNPRAQGVWVSDPIDAIDGNVEARINRAIDSIHADQGVEIAVVCVESVDTPTPKDFATALFNHWGIGKAGKDNGLLVLLVRGQRRLEMETGYGLESVLTDGWLKTMQGAEMVPFFKAGDHGSGLEAGVNASISRLRKYPSGVPAGTDDPSPQRVASPGSTARGVPAEEPPSPWSWLLIGGVAVGGAGGIGAWTHRKNRTCPTCKVRMTMIPEEEDDAQLDEGQKTEERLGSVDHQFYVCNGCDFNKLIPVRAWFSGYGTCHSCSYKTSETSSHVIEHATYTSTGLREVTVHCKHCGHHDVSTRTIPMKVQSSSSSSSSSGGGSGGGSSFGGGRSGGGGAGSSW